MRSSPTCNRTLPRRLGGFPSLREALDYAAQGDTGVNFFDSRGNLATVLHYRTLRADALATARWMRAQGMREGDRFGLIADTSPGFLTLFYAAQYAGAVPCPLPYSAYPGARDGYVARLRHLLARTQARWVFAPEGALPRVRDAAPGLHAFAFDDATGPGVRHAHGGPGKETSGKRIACDDIPAYVQFSSGSTAEPRGVVVRQSALMANATAIAVHGLRMRGDDRACSWLPLYHDMGLVGFSVVAMCSQRSVDYLSPATFAARPTVWLRLMAQQGTTIAYAPCFAWKLAAERYRGESHIDLSALRVAGVGGDMVQPAMLDECATALADTGLRFSSFQPSYGMAEATLAICMSDADDDPRIDRAARDAGESLPHPPLSAGATHGFVSCGAPLPGMEVRVEDDDGAPCPPGRIGRIRVRGPSVMEGYLNDPEASRRVLSDDGYLDTGDLGYCLDGELFLAGRAKDMILIRGRNLWPQDIEWMAERIAPLASGDTAAIGVPDGDDGERLVLLVQRGIANRDERRALRDALVDAIAGTWGVAARILFVPPRSLPLTSSGKLARAHAKARYLAGAWDESHTSRPSAKETVA